jgi:hypothetical protein
MTSIALDVDRDFCEVAIKDGRQRTTKRPGRRAAERFVNALRRTALWVQPLAVSAFPEEQVTNESAQAYPVAMRQGKKTAPPGRGRRWSLSPSRKDGTLVEPICLPQQERLQGQPSGDPRSHSVQLQLLAGAGPRAPIAHVQGCLAFNHNCRRLAAQTPPLLPTLSRRP